MSTTHLRSGPGAGPEATPPGALDERASVRQALARDGVAKVGAVLDADQIRRILGWLDAREAEGDELARKLQRTFDVGPDGRRRVGKVRRLFWSDPHFWADIVVSSRIARLAVDLVGPGATLLFHTAFMKPSGFGSEMTLHQDQGVTPWDLPYVLTMWIALTPSTVANGCIIGYPGSHRHGLIPHLLEDGTVADRTSKRLPSLPSIPPSYFQSDTPVPYEVHPGEAVLWHHFFVHGSAENRSGMDRKGMALVFADASRPGYTPPDVDFSGRPMEPLSIADIRALAAHPDREPR